MAPPSLPQPVGRHLGDETHPRSGVFDLPAVPAAVGLARTSVRRLLARWGTGDGTTDNAVLVISELVTNAVKHTGSVRIACRVRVDGHLLHIEVEDENRAGTLPIRRRPGPEDQGGRGLLLVGMLSGDWGVRDAPHGSGRVVWAVLAPEPGEAVAAPEPGEAVATGPPHAPHRRPAPHPPSRPAPQARPHPAARAEAPEANEQQGPPRHGTTARL